MRQLILMRHGKAETASGGGDHARALSGRGRAEAAVAARRLATLAHPRLALVSDSKRTRETFDAMAPHLDPAPPHRATRTLYGATAESILAEVRGAPDDAECLLVIGHNPGIGDLARRLAGSGANRDVAALRLGFPTSCFGVIEFEAASWAEVGEPGRLGFLFAAEDRSGA